ncbi:hypothetical protein Pst134EA_023235 [Puccinia striiformis f. sp. tritici]|uniref:hypothetical protein n=1 Tax=Puccinia striiformis f. sp. tritici TaxID=168172 RepID=UPI0020076BFE|nr:hypothetical protein Pst134EA_023235 [Puccinia striiformis f. sp. tritici]KAH9455787.1 hypothetical protein Pst134EA_023235 [Puccinia striiformis f. sp. tritici]
MDNFGQPQPLEYSIHSSSTCSTIYHPFNILEHAPTEPNSRWSGSGPTKSPATATDSSSPSLDIQANLNYPAQLAPKKKDYIIIDLGKPSIVRSITFGKFHRPHPCNVKQFRIWGSLAPGEGKGDFRGLLGHQPDHLQNSATTIVNSLVPNQPNTPNLHQSIFKHPPANCLASSSSSLSKPDPSSSGSLNPIELEPHDLNSSQPTSSSQLPIRVRGPAQRAGPRMELLAQGELKNDTVPETVPLRWKNDRVAWFRSSGDHYQSSSDPTISTNNHTVIVPVRYIKIEPLSATGSNYNCSIWHISVKGHNEDHIISPCLEIYEKWRASAALRLCLKHLRETGHLEAFQALMKSAGDPDQSPMLAPSTSNPPTSDMSNRGASSSATFLDSQSTKPVQFHFEHSLVSALHSALVPHLNPRFGLDGPLDSASRSPNDNPYTIPPISGAEQIVIQAALENLFDPWAQAEPPTLACHQILPHLAYSPPGPRPRGGHQMCIDSKRRKIWLFGGFDGLTDLGDLWVYHLEPAHLSTQEDSATSPSVMMDGHSRSKETIDARPTAQSHGNNKDTRYNRWQLISRDVRLDNGPMNRSCHKMVLDEITGDLYVLGRYADRCRPTNAQASDQPQATTNGNSTTNPIEVPDDIVSAGNGTGNSSGGQAGIPSEFGAGITIEILRRHFRPPVQVPDTKTLKDSDNVPYSATVQYKNGQFKNDMFRFRPFEDSLSDELWDNNGRIGKWDCLSEDTYAEDGPQLIFDHQMVLDSDRRKMYVFGGKIIQHESTPSVRSDRYSGLFEYDLTTQTWTQLMTDKASKTLGTIEIDDVDPRLSIPLRMGHSLILDKKRHCLWVLTGERDHHYYSDLWKYDIDNGRAELVTSDYTNGEGDPSSSGIYSGSAPEAGFSQRTTFDPEADEWHMFCGLCRDRSLVDTVSNKNNIKSEMMSSEFWRWRINDRKWTKVAMKAQVDGTDIPPPRFAHQMVFDELTKTHYVFGGNPADNEHEPTRLGDFWKLKLNQPTRPEALRRCLFALRRQHFIEMCEKGTDAAGALFYLQNDLSSVTNHMDEREARLFRACTSHLLAGPGPREPLLEEAEEHDDGLVGGDMEEDGEDYRMMKSDEDHPDRQYDFRRSDFNLCYQRIKDQRTCLFQSILKFFPPSITEPEESLSDLIDVWGDRESFW